MQIEILKEAWPNCGHSVNLQTHLSVTSVLNPRGGVRNNAFHSSPTRACALGSQNATSGFLIRKHGFAAALNAQISPINSRTQEGDRAQTVHL